MLPVLGLPLSFSGFLDFILRYNSLDAIPVITLAKEEIIENDSGFLYFDNFNIHIQKKRRYEPLYSLYLGRVHFLENGKINQLIRAEITHLPPLDEFVTILFIELSKMIGNRSFFRKEGYCYAKEKSWGLSFCPISLHRYYIFKQLLQNISLDKDHNLIL